MGRLHVIACTNRSEVGLLTAIHRLRYRVFKHRMDWDVAISGGMELDHYDILNPTYLALVDENRDLLGCARLLPTLGPNMLADTFNVLLDGAPAPRAADIWESSRFCIDTGRAEATLANGLRGATPAILAGMTEWCLGHAVSTIVTVTDLVVERVLARAGCPMARIAAPLRIGKTVAVAGTIGVCTELLENIRTAGELDGPVLQDEEAADQRRRRA